MSEKEQAEPESAPAQTFDWSDVLDWASRDTGEEPADFDPAMDVVGGKPDRQN